MFEQFFIEAKDVKTKTTWFVLLILISEALITTRLSE